jgi:hypothetical protein
MYSVVIIPDPVPCEVELSPVQSGTVTLSARGPANGTYQWRVGGRTLTGSAPRVYLPPGRHPIALTVRDGPLGASCGGVKIAHRPLVTEPARVASRLVWSGGHTFSVNDDDASVVRVDPATQRRVWLHALGGGEPVGHQTVVRGAKSDISCAEIPIDNKVGTRWNRRFNLIGSCY